MNHDADRSAHFARLTDDALVAFTATLPGYYDEDEIRANLALVKQVPWGGRIVELGVQFGRSASIYFQELGRRLALPDRPVGPPFLIDLVDVWNVDGDDARRHFEQLVVGLGVEGAYKGWWMRTDEADPYIPGPIDLLHIDADHIDGVHYDCEHYIPKLVPGGWVLIHDYNRGGWDGESEPMFPEIKKAVDRWTREYGLEDHGVVNTLAIRRRPL